jgi:predicted O-methyltransferase YrrM
MLPYRVYSSDWLVPPVEVESTDIYDAMAVANSIGVETPCELWQGDRRISKFGHNAVAAGPELEPAPHIDGDDVHKPQLRKQWHWWDLAVRLSHALLRTTPAWVRVRTDTWVALDQCGAVRPWVKTFRYLGRWLDYRHAYFGNAPGGRMGVSFCIDIGIDGYLTNADAAKLYELAYFGRGDVLELGTARGLSASIISAALRARGSGRLHTVGFDPVSSAKAQQTIPPWAAPDRIDFHIGDAAEIMDCFVSEERKFGFIFVDQHEVTRKAALRIPALLAPGGFVQFHDYSDPSPAPPHHPDKVWNAVNDTIGSEGQFRFCCVTATSAVFQRCS